MTDRYARRRALLLTKYWRWEWHFPMNGRVWIRSKETGRVIDVGKVE